jgi:predicted phage terminase large subunit-like protein
MFPSHDPLAVFVYYKHLDKIRIIRVYQLWMEAPDLIKEIKKIISIYGLINHTRVIFEPKASGKTLSQILRTEGILCEEDKAPTESKETRVELITPFIERGQIELPEEYEDRLWVNSFMDECATFPGGRDDQVDCLSAVCRIELMNRQGITISGHSAFDI